MVFIDFHYGPIWFRGRGAIEQNKPDKPAKAPRPPAHPHHASTFDNCLPKWQFETRRSGYDLGLLVMFPSCPCPLEHSPLPAVANRFAPTAGSLLVRARSQILHARSRCILHSPHRQPHRILRARSLDPKPAAATVRCSFAIWPPPVSRGRVACRRGQATRSHRPPASLTMAGIGSTPPLLRQFWRRRTEMEIETFMWVQSQE